jgi:hypothetical protein
LARPLQTGAPRCPRPIVSLTHVLSPLAKCEGARQHDPFDGGCVLAVLGLRGRAGHAKLRQASWDPQVSQPEVSSSP